MKVAIVIPTLSKYDAVGNDAMGMYHYFVKRDCKVRFFVNETTHEKLPVDSLGRLKKFVRTDDLVVLHHSIGWPGSLEAIRALDCRKVLKYHNITPAHFFTGISSEFERSCELGRTELARVSSTRFDLYLGDSAFNIKDLQDSTGIEGNFGVVPPFHHTDELVAREAAFATLIRLNDDSKNILCVGRLVPNKGHMDLIRAFSHYYHHYNQRSRLLLIGHPDPRLSTYTGKLRDLVQEENLENGVQIFGGVRTPDLKAVYLTADLVVMVSQHEGFCVPLVEAMAFRIPIVALGAGAVGETVGQAGIVWDEFDPALFSVSMNCVLSDSRTSLALGKMGRKRYDDEFSTRIIERKLSNGLKSIGVHFG
ncbi:MAG TPA: glycosyltransferase [Acidobacteriota bacterium]|nr:glycosyltransferase [Acidobacteriota bacterium]